MSVQNFRTNAGPRAGLSESSWWRLRGRRALLRTKTFPLDVNGKVPARMVVSMRPKT